jgi:FixJ family two-component response regulator
MNLNESASMQPSASRVKPIVFVVDDDVSLRDSLQLLIECAGWQPFVYATADEFLSHPPVFVPSCLVLDLTLPGISGLDLQNLLANRPGVPVIFITAYGNVRLTVRAMKAGAVEFLTKPFPDDLLLDAIREAFDRSDTVLRREAALHVLSARHASLSSREREVMALVITGLINRQIGSELGISEITVKGHRGRMMRKMQAQSLAHLISMASELHPQQFKSGSGLRLSGDGRC